MGPEIAAAAAIGSLALDAGSSIIKGQGEQAQQEFLAQRDERAAQLGRIKADQTDVNYREELTATLANIDVTRAAAGADPLSSTSLAVGDENRRISDRARRTAVANIQSQVDESEASALYRRRVGEQALLGGYIGAGAKGLKGFAPYLKGTG